jgi:hypothetical protein
MHFLALFLGWCLFTLAAVNLADVSARYIRRAEGSAGVPGAIIRWVLIGFSFAAWQWLTYGKF